MRRIKTISRILILTFLGLIMAFCQKDDLPETEPEIEVSSQLKVAMNTGQLLDFIKVVESLVDHETLNTGNGNALIVNAKHAIDLLESKKFNAAKGQLGALINKIETYRKVGILTMLKGEELITYVKLSTNFCKCPLFTRNELYRIGTLGGSYRENIIIDDPYQNFTISEGNFKFRHLIQINNLYVSSNNDYFGRYHSLNTGYPDADKKMILKECEYNACKLMILLYLDQGK